MRVETKIFVSTFLVVFSSVFFGVFMLIPFYYGHPLIDLGRLRSWVSGLFIVVFFFLSLIVAGVSVVFYWGVQNDDKRESERETMKNRISPKL